ncbi:hypothetical protein IscW_ISCW009380 [Ixodes scapularis]|uniref:Uncharacterized protein n=1 Tax=Ixodes scapularis TaxID=6945 RepID=B7Q2L4_IXOSC|nr:hypothetical protein IscW_ISCW009380 [Ixodes scapularis]|eukprot:XP_002410892.1 hypothetical protein IscW_ISCW009380 [Ixodes scapularis]
MLAGARVSIREFVEPLHLRDLPVENHNNRAAGEGRLEKSSLLAGGLTPAGAGLLAPRHHHREASNGFGRRAPRGKRDFVGGLFARQEGAARRRQKRLLFRKGGASTRGTHLDFPGA